METRKRILVFASGTKDGGGSGFEFLVRACQEGRIKAEVVGVVSQYAHGGTKRIAEKLRVPFLHYSSAKEYTEARRRYQPDFTILWGWTKFAFGLDPRTTINVHPAPLPAFGGKGMYGLAVHEKVLEAFAEGELTHTEVCLQFVTAEYDGGPVFFRQPVVILKTDTPQSLQEAVKEYERSAVLHTLPHVLKGAIRWDGRDSSSLRRVPELHIVAS